ncbi:MAG: hypothetical protein WC592_02280 [Candidatus Omnitrophota bacterium]|nr:hypothetical protein [Candidatus Omnitrophota bacterium]
MIDIKSHTTHPTDVELAGFLGNSLAADDRKRVETHIYGCEECLARVVSAYESVNSFNKKGLPKKRKGNIMNRINLYFVLAAISFALSFAVPRYFLQLLAATLLLGAKWIADSKTTKMLVMIHEAWKNGGGREASRVLEKFESAYKGRL